MYFGRRDAAQIHEHCQCALNACKTLFLFVATVDDKIARNRLERLRCDPLTLRSVLASPPAAPERILQARDVDVCTHALLLALHLTLERDSALASLDAAVLSDRRRSEVALSRTTTEHGVAFSTTTPGR